MRILLANHLYHPILGGSVVLTDAIAEALIEQGHEVRVTTKTPGPSEGKITPVQRRPTMPQLVSWMRWSNGVIIIEPSVTYCVAASLAGRPYVASLQTWFPDENGRSTANTRIRRFIGNLLGKITAPSMAISQSWGGGYPIVPNGFEPRIFHNLNSSREWDYVFLGRMIEDKGPDLFVKSLQRLHLNGDRFKALVIGDGDLMPLCRQLVADLPGLSEKVTFSGHVRSREEIAILLNKCHVLAIPNRWEEPFGMVALEALACGCRLVITRSGALAEVAGSHALVVEKNDVEDLARQMRRARYELESNPEKIALHLRDFQWSRIARRYLSFIE